jgi:hypothetical protein
LARWALILHEYDFDIIHRPNGVDRNADGLSQNPSSNEEDTIGALWHGDVDLEVIPKWHAFVYLCTLLGCYGDVPHINLDNGDRHDVDMESKGMVLWIFMMMHLSLHICKQMKVLIGLIAKERDHVVHRAKHFKSEGNSFLWMWANGQVKVLPCLEQCESFMRHAHEELGHFGV